MTELESFRVGLRVPVETKDWLCDLAGRSGVGAVGFFSQCVVLGARQLERAVKPQGSADPAKQHFPPFDIPEVHREAETLSTG